MTCLGCPAFGILPFQLFFPMVVKVLDANGNPIPNKEVDWTLVTSNTALPFFNAQSFTDGNGVATNQLFQNAQFVGSAAFPFTQTVINAAADGAFVQFTETQALTVPTSNSNAATALVFARILSPGVGTSFIGTTGGTDATKISVHVDGLGGQPVQGVSVRLLNTNNPSSGATASCATGVGADPGSVLTDATGLAVCTVVYGPISGNGAFTVIVGGVDPLEDPTHIVVQDNTAFAYFQSGSFPITVKAGVPGQIQVSSGNNQTVNAGQATQPLVFKVLDSSGLNTIANQAVNFTVSPAGAVTFNPASTTTNAQGLATTTATLASNAVGVITVNATVPGTNLSTNLTINVSVQVTGVQKISGDSQSAPAGQPFGSPLVVQVNASNGQPAANVPVSFQINGPGTLNTTSVNTGANGRAQVTVGAGSSPGNVTVTASVGGFSQTFNLTVIPPGPSLNTGRILNGADFQVGAISPCSIVTVQATGLAPNIQGTVVPSGLYGPLPYVLGGDKVTINNSQAPIYSLSNVNGTEQITFQLPCDVTPGSGIPMTVNVSGGSATANINVFPASPGIFQTVMADGVSRAVLVRPDGSFVSLANPARRGEIIRLYATGTGPVTPSVGTNSIAVPGADSLVTGQVIVGVNNAGARVISARLAPSLIGVYEVAFQVDSNAPIGNDIVLSLAVNVPGDQSTRFSAGSKIPIQ